MFFHSSSTDSGSSESPILLYSENKLNIIGIHKGGNNEKKINVGNFIEEVIESLITNRNYFEVEKEYICEVIESGYKKGTFFKEIKNIL